MKLDFDYNDRAGEYVATIGDGTLYRVRAVPDSDGESPRDWDNVATMVCEHRRYNLGDKDGARLAREAVRQSRDYRDTWEESESGFFRFNGETRDCLDLSEPCDIWTAMQMCSDIVSAPLYLYDHSGISISTGGFSCPWDSGQVGFAFVTLATISRERKWRTMCKPAVQWARRCIDVETETYDSFLRGDIYGYVCERASGWEDGEPEDWEEFDSCWGFFGHDFDASGLAEQAAAAIAADMADRRDTVKVERAAAIAAIRDLAGARRTLSGLAREAVQSRIAAHAADARRANVESRLLAGES